jgi:hypothetical protein
LGASLHFSSRIFLQMESGFLTVLPAVFLAFFLAFLGGFFAPLLTRFF